ncbi:MAG: H-type lectin domain-containing protein [Pseudomonadota bacterium]
MIRLVLALALILPAAAYGQVTSTFSYQGQLELEGELANGSFDFEFALFDSPDPSTGVLTAGPLSILQVPVRNGIFSVELDFGPGAFGGFDQWLEIRVASAGNNLQTLLPRPLVATVPLAQQAAGVEAGVVDSAQLAAGAVGTRELADAGVAAADVDASQIQLRVTASCPPGSYVRQIGGDGSVFCQPDSDTDTDTQYTAGSGLQLNAGEFAINPLETQLRVTGVCPEGSSIRTIADDGSVVCQADTDTDTDTQYTAGTGLTLSDDQFAVDPTVAQTRVTGTCSAGSFITAVNEDGTVVCAAADTSLRRDPLVQSGFANVRLAADSGGNYGWVPFLAGFSSRPITLLTIDESLNDNGATWVRLRREARRRAGVRAEATVDGLHWFAMDEGVFTVDEKLVQAGKASPAANNQTIFFPQLFDTPPVVFLTVDESVDDSGAFRSRVIGNVGNGGFQIWLDAAADGVNWVAMEAGDYNHGRYTWRAGTHVPGGCTNPCSVTFGSDLSGTPTVLLQINDVDNSGPTWARVLNASAGGFDYRLESAAAELVHWLAVVEVP